ncbi:gephyrin-like molybdotransferase Glp [Xanthomonas campestris pv. raphani]|uniref:molybdopterin molybdotransferase MoeA n=1 Tax=Xanthomonas campestris TaxID=339 RepID=UPI002368251D|nr:gephyrin-like molybdotransferase Glp [Xanthomonas campestris]MEA9755738.1 gephyrin-like molybdotransferase Glp [Xanthomonas campestris pv. raphani]MEA9762210.1 gephyrin-like molybdotransferase Glp [Xanthomonas campestris pv. raphani]MEA9815676.1 gephyrin-like molybdotransferase Glp [Xanthomonas campestris pv. raphani]MEA9822900.1 gephyrin-like molybdotransferase Glp [Xanthomonas campestris pv. raphani]MEA9851274.1 gephyrin-like molybdotransferase Glp [Xanthomonas campestris pv. raphani]
MTDYPSRIPYARALEILRAVAANNRLPDENIATSRADGRISAADLIAPMSLPPFANSSMDGFAVRHADTLGEDVRLQLVGEQFAGDSWSGTLTAGHCLRITTGAPLPAGADTVVPKEDADEQAGLVHLRTHPTLGAAVRLAGSDVRAGDLVIQPGQVLTPARIGLAAALGVSRLAVAPRPTIAVLATGDELVEPGMPLGPGQIYNSNRDMLMAQLRALGYAPTAWPTLPDDPQRIRTMLEDAAAAFDVVITCGGVSAGEKDYLPRLIQELGQIHFWRVRMRPGMPAVLGQIGRCLVLGLPGNPVSVLATLIAYGVPLLDALQSRSEPRPVWHAALSAPWDKRHERLEFLRGRLDCGADGRLVATPHRGDASHLLRGAADSNVLIVLPEPARHYEAGEVVRVIPYAL